jgi:hypothetical protein
MIVQHHTPTENNYQLHWLMLIILTLYQRFIYPIVKSLERFKALRSPRAGVFNGCAQNG